MKMTLHIDEALLERVVTAYGCESKTAAVDLALREMERKDRLAGFAKTGLGFSAAELREAVDPDYDVMAGRQEAGGWGTPNDKPKTNARRRAR